MTNALYHVLLLAFSASLRQRWGGDMTQLLRDQMDDAERRGESQARVLWLAIWDALGHGLGERLSRAHGWLVAPLRKATMTPGEGTWRD